MRGRVWYLVVALLLSAPSFVRAQGASITGRIVDQTGGVLPGTSVTAMHIATGTSRETVTNSEGLYSLPALQVGRYTVEASLAGYQTVLIDNVEVVVGAATTVNFAMKASGVEETITVTGAAPLINVTSSELKHVTRAEQIQSVPLLSRDFTGLVTLTPGVRTSVPPPPSASRQGTMSFGGATSGMNVSILVDGADNRDENLGGVLLNMTLEGIEEFKVSSSRFDAVEGKTGGAVISITTKSGTNALHGTGFYQLRNEALTAKDYFTKQSNQSETPYDRKQFGGNFGGPIVRNRMFYFGAIERVRENRELALPANVITQLQLLATAVPGVKAGTSMPQPKGEWRSVGKVNVELGAGHAAFLRWASEDTNHTNNQGGTSRDLMTTSDINKLWSLVGSETWIMSPRAVNQLTVQGARYRNAIDGEHPPTRLNLVFPSLYTGRGSPSAFTQLTELTTVQVRDNINLLMGTHNMQFGGSYIRYLKGPGGYTNLYETGKLAFFDDPSTILTNAVVYPQGFQTPGIVQSFTSAAPNSQFQSADTVQNVGLWVQDEWRVTRQLTFNLGLRYDVEYGLPGMTDLERGRAGQALRAIGNPHGGFMKNDINNVSPRVGFTYQWHEGRDVVRGGAGRYFTPLTTSPLYFQLIEMKEFLGNTVTKINTSIGVGDLAIYRYGVDPTPATLSTGLRDLPFGGRATGSWISPNLESPVSYEFHGGYSHQFAHQTALSVDYLGMRNRKAFTNLNINPIVNGVRLLAPDFGRVLGDPNILGTVNILQSNSESNYDELSFATETRVRRVRLEASYTLSKAQGFGGSVGALGGWTPRNQLDPFNRIEYGPGQVDERHRVVVSGLFTLPYGIDLAPRFQAASARPYTLTAGRDLNGDGANTDFYVDPATGQPVGVNSQRGNPFRLFDLRATKRFSLAHGPRLEAFVEIFNLFNKANFGERYQGNALSAAFKQPIALMTDTGYARQAQIGARFTF